MSSFGSGYGSWKKSLYHSRQRTPTSSENSRFLALPGFCANWPVLMPLAAAVFSRGAKASLGAAVERVARTKVTLGIPATKARSRWASVRSTAKSGPIMRSSIGALVGGPQCFDPARARLWPAKAPALHPGVYAHRAAKRHVSAWRQVYGARPSNLLLGLAKPKACLVFQRALV